MGIRFKPEPGYGTRQQLYVASGLVKDLRSQGGNQDGLIGNEKHAAGTPAGPMARPAILAQVAAFVGPGLSTADEQKLVDGYLAAKRKEWGEPITTLDLSARSDAKLIEVAKAATLERLGRRPSEISEGFLSAAGVVNGKTIEPREIFWQAFPPPAGVKPSHKTVVLPPGFKETTHHFLEQVKRLNAQGHEVVLMDQQWAGLSEGDKGGMDSLFGVARDIAVVTAHAQARLEARAPKAEHPEAEVVLGGNSMGGGAAFFARLLADHDRIQLQSPDLRLADGSFRQMPKGVKGSHSAPYFGTTPGVLNQLLIGLASPELFEPITTLKLPELGLPKLSSNPWVNARNNQTALLTRTPAQLETMASGREDLATGLGLLASGLRPLGDTHIVQGADDSLNDFDATRRLVGLLGEGAELRVLPTSDHVLEEHPVYADALADGVSRVASGKVRTEPLPAPPGVDARKGLLEKAEAKLGAALGKLVEDLGPPPIGWALEGKPATDATARFDALYEAAKSGALKLPEKVKDVTVLLVPGLFTERYPGYMDETKAALQKAGAKVELVKIDTDASAESNAKKIALHIARAKGKVLPFAHSKGVTDTLEALARHPQLADKLASGVMLQGVVSGTMVARDVVQCEELRSVVGGFIEDCFHGDAKALSDLTYDARQKFFAEHPLPDGLDLVSVASACDHPLAPTAAGSGYIQALYHQPSDGLVAVDDAIVPGSRAVKLKHLDHAAAVMPQPAFLAEYQPGPLAVAAVALALDEK